MADKAKQVVGITITRETRQDVKLVQATGFKLRFDKTTGFFDIHLERRGLKGERVSFDPVLLQSNLAMMKQYIMGMPCEEDEASQKEEISVPDADSYANVIHLCQMGGRAETIFSLFRYADWVQAAQQDGKSKDREITSADQVVVVSSCGLQKKLMLELLTTLAQHQHQHQQE
jgi:hypothetical protein